MKFNQRCKIRRELLGLSLSDGFVKEEEHGRTTDI